MPLFSRIFLLFGVSLSLCASACSCGPPALLCRTAETLCGTTCADTQHDTRHCGGCEKACNDGQICATDSCAWCPESRPTKCGGAADDQSGQECRNTFADPQHCSGCGKACKSDEVCNDGKCVADPAQPGCPKGCGIGQRCVAPGVCACLSGRVMCDGRCVDTDTDWDHCGSCKNACPTGRFCAAGKCELRCPDATPTVCFGGCFNVQYTAQHCGRCGNRALGGKVCRNGALQCPDHLLECKGACVDLDVSPLHCGACGQRCQVGEFCDLGKCRTCQVARVCGAECCEKASCCGDKCVDTKTNPNHCGSCGKVCASKQCINGACLP